MPHIIEFFKNLSSTELPNYIQSSINEGKKLEYKYLEIHPEEQFEYQSMCINWTEFIEIYKVLKSNPTLYFVEETKEYKALKQLMNNEDMFKTKIDNDENNLKKSYVYFFNEKSFINDQLKEKMTGQKNKKVAFENKDVSNDEKSILENIKYCFYVVLKT